MTPENRGEMRSPMLLWKQADEEASDIYDEGDRSVIRRARYLELMREHGHIIDREPGDTSPLFPCGYDPRGER